MDHTNARWPHLGAQALRQGVSRRLGSRVGAVRGEIGQGVNRQQVHPSAGVGHPIGGAPLQSRAQGLGQAQQAQVIDLHFHARHVGAGAVANAVAAMHLGVVDDDVHLATDLASQGGDRALIAQVEWQHGHLWDRSQLSQARQLLPRFGMAHPHDVRTRFDQGAHQGLTHRGFAVGDQGLAELGVAAHFAQHFVVGHVLALFLWKTYQHRLARTVQTRTHPNPAGGLGDLAVQVHHHRWPRIQRHHAQAPGQALAKKQIIAVVQGGAGQQLAPARLRAPLQAR